MKSPTRTAFPIRKRVSWDSGTPRPRAMFSVDSEPWTCAPVRSATAATSRAWSWWLCVAKIAAGERTSGRAVQASTVAGSLPMRAAPMVSDSTTASREGRVRKASTRNCVRPSSSSSVLVP